jgi:DNA ligase (NAD+)
MTTIVKLLLNPKNDPIEIANELTINELETVIEYANDKYYNTDNSVFTEGIYDMLIDFLKLKNPKSKILKSVGFPTKNKVTLDYWLGSMDKIKPSSTSQLDNWIKKYKPPYNLSDKLDGISALLVYKMDGTIGMFTRGTATEGLDISKLIKYLNLPKWKSVEIYCKKNKIKGNINLIAFRGELIIKENTFNNNWSSILKNGRNSVAGLINSKSINPDLAKDTDLVLYEVVEPFLTITDQLTIIKDIGFNTVINKTINKNINFELLSKYFTKRRSNSEYKIDGIIVTSCENKERNINGNPEYAFAFKDILEEQKAKSTVISIEWNISKDGLIKPVIIIEPVIIGGVEIKRVTGNNAKFIMDNKLGPKAQVEIIRSGDVIPKIEKVIKSGICSLPNMDFKWNETKVDIILNNFENSSNVLIKNIYYFFSKLETKGLGEKNVEKMYNYGLNTIPKILSSTKESLMNIFGEKTSDNLITNIKKALLNVSLSKLMSASNKLGHGIGEERIKQILNVYPNLMNDYKKWTKIEFINNIKQLDGWEDKTSTLFVNNFNLFVDFYISINQYIILKKEATKKENKFKNMTFVFSGFRDKELEKKIEDYGGKIISSVSKNTDYLVVKNKNDTSSKILQAKKYNIKIITIDELII